MACFKYYTLLSMLLREVLQVVQFVKGEEYAKFTRIVFDTAPTGHTLRLLTGMVQFSDSDLICDSGAYWQASQHVC